MTTLEERARAWIEPHWNLEHLVRTREWLLEIEPDASEALRLAALTHDVERQFPGGPVQDLSISPDDDIEYRRVHAERSARSDGGSKRTCFGTSISGASTGAAWLSRRRNQRRLGVGSTGSNFALAGCAAMGSGSGSTSSGSGC